MAKGPIPGKDSCFSICIRLHAKRCPIAQSMDCNAQGMRGLENRDQEVARKAGRENIQCETEQATPTRCLTRLAQLKEAFNEWMGCKEMQDRSVANWSSRGYMCDVHFNAWGCHARYLLEWLKKGAKCDVNINEFLKGLNQQVMHLQNRFENDCVPAKINDSLVPKLHNYVLSCFGHAQSAESVCANSDCFLDSAAATTNQRDVSQRDSFLDSAIGATGPNGSPLTSQRGVNQYAIDDEEDANVTVSETEWHIFYVTFMLSKSFEHKSAYCWLVHARLLSEWFDGKNVKKGQELQ